MSPEPFVCHVKRSKKGNGAENVMGSASLSTIPLAASLSTHLFCSRLANVLCTKFKTSTFCTEENKQTNKQTKKTKTETKQNELPHLPLPNSTYILHCHNNCNFDCSFEKRLTDGPTSYGKSYILLIFIIHCKTKKKI